MTANRGGESHAHREGPDRWLALIGEQVAAHGAEIHARGSGVVAGLAAAAAAAEGTPAAAAAARKLLSQQRLGQPSCGQRIWHFLSKQSKAGSAQPKACP